MKKVLAMLLLVILLMAVAPMAVITSKGTTIKLSAVTSAQGKISGDPPDLTLSPGDIGFAPSEPAVGETVTITATIHNIGNANAKSVLVHFNASSTFIGEDKIAVIPKGGSRQAEIGWIPDVAGNYIIRIVVDPVDTIDEINETNNEASKTITVVAAAPPPAIVHDVAVTSVTPSATEVTAGEVVTITVVVENQGTETETFDVTSYYGSVAIGTQPVTELAADTSETLTFSWDTTGLEGTYTIKAEASVVPDETDTADNTLTDGTVTVSAPGVPPTATHELFIEIDYIEGHAPNQTVLDYIEWYYMGNNPSGELISVTFYVNDSIPYVGAYAGINDDEFWAIEKAYNNMGDDAYGTRDSIFGTAGVYSSKWKWILYGTTVEGAPNVIGYTYVIIARIGRTYDLLAGNYIFIADGAADSWAGSQEPPIEPYGAEAVVLMHEMGHSIGVAKLSWRGAEIYDPDSGSVMSYLSTANAKLYWAWYYSKEYWATRNMEYYTV